MHPVLTKNLFFVKEHVGMFKAANNYDILDPETNEELILCRENNLGFFTKMLRFSDYKRMTPFHVELATPHGQQVVSVRRGWTFWRSKVEVMDENGQNIGMFRQKMLSIGGRFEILNARGDIICELKGKWTSWEFSFLRGGNEIAKVTKKWAGIGKELFTTADNYILSIDQKVDANDEVRMLIMAAVMCIDMVLKE